MVNTIRTARKARNGDPFAGRRRAPMGPAGAGDRFRKRSIIVLPSARLILIK
jgi:hypothetical protein